jgi:hypothetical protein
MAQKERSTMSLRVTNFNVGNRKTETVHNIIEELAKSSDLMVFNEMADQSLPTIKGWKGQHNKGVAPGLQRNPVMWRPDKLRLIKHTYRLVVKATWVGQEGAGGPMMSNKYVEKYVFRDLESGERLVVYPVHAIPSHYIARRKALHILHMTALGASTRIQRALGRKTLVVGDFNEAFHKSTVAETECAGRSNHTRLGVIATFKDRAIDAQIGGGIRAKTHRVVLKWDNGDHKPLIVDWLLS